MGWDEVTPLEFDYVSRLDKAQDQPHFMDGGQAKLL